MRANGPHKIWAFHLAPTLSSTSCLAKCIASKVTKDQLNRHHDCKCPPLFTCKKNKTFLKTFPHRDREPPCVHMLLKNLNTAGGISVLVNLERINFCDRLWNHRCNRSSFRLFGYLIVTHNVRKKKGYPHKIFFYFLSLGFDRHSSEKASGRWMYSGEMAKLLSDSSHS